MGKGQIENQLDKLDYRILEFLMNDARTPYLEIARECNVSGATVHLRIQKLERLGIINGSRLIADYRKLGLGISAYLGIHMEKADQYDDMFAKLRAIPEVVECYLTTGNYGIFLKVFCRDTTHLRELLLDKIQKIPNVNRTETFISLQQVFDREPDLNSVLDLNLTEEPAKQD